MDGVPPDLAERLTRARATLEAREDGELPLAARRAVRERFGPWQPLDGPHPQPGLIRRVALERATVERVLDAWKKERPDDDRPQRMLALADAVLQRAVDSDAASAEADRFGVALDDLEKSGEVSQAALAAALASVATVATARAGDYDDEPPDLEDRDLSPESWEAAYHASYAASGFPDEDRERLRAYWRWYLDEAVPAAWHTS
jgi:Immunity protein Imm5